MQETKLKTSKLVNIVNKKKSITFFLFFFFALDAKPTKSSLL